MSALKLFITLSICFFFNLTLLAENQTEKLVILGAGSAGSSSAIFAGQADLHPLVIEGPECGAQISVIRKIDNYPGLLEEIDGSDLLKIFQEQARRFGARFHSSWAEEVDLSSRPFKIALSNGDTVYTEALIIASGTTKRWLGLDAEQMLRGKGVYGASACRKDEVIGKEVIVIGGGHAALQEAHHVSETAAKVTLLNRGEKFNASVFHQQQVFDNEKITLLYNSEITEIFDVAQDKVTGARVHNVKTGEDIELPAEVIIVAIGNTPNTELFKDQLDMTQAGNIMTVGKTTATEVPGVFAAGDASEFAYGRVVIAAGAGGMAALDAARFIDSHPLE